MSSPYKDTESQDVQIIELTQRLAQVTAERDQLRHQDPERYEERIGMNQWFLAFCKNFFAFK